MEPEGMTRAWPTVALIRRKTRITQNQASASRRIFCSVVRFSSDWADFPFFDLAGLTFMGHRDWAVGLDWRRVLNAGIFQQLPVCAAFANFQLHEVGWINARITRRTKIAFGVVHRLLQSGERDVTERIRPEEFADLFGRIARSDQLFARRRVHSVIA